jgi:CubicO group peptidase (beta-lactamase class C family)
VRGLSGVLLVRHKGKEVFFKEIQTPSLRVRLPLSKEQAFPIASISKTFTAAAARYLAETGQLQLEKTLCDFFCSTCDLPIGKATIEDLLRHKSGLTDSMPNIKSLSLQFLQSFMDSERSMQQKIASAGFQENLRGTFQYSNLGYAILAKVIEISAGKPFVKVVEDSLLVPLNLSETSFLKLDKKLQAHLNPLGIFCTFAGCLPAKSEELPNHTGSGSMISTVKNLSVWMEAFSKPESTQVGKLKSILLLPHSQIFQVQHPFSYYATVFWHNGSLPGFNSIAASYPTEDLNFVWLSNLDSDWELEFQKALFSLLEEKPYHLPTLRFSNGSL